LGGRKKERGATAPRSSKLPLTPGEHNALLANRSPPDYCSVTSSTLGEALPSPTLAGIMANPSASTSGSADKDLPQSLTDRVMARVIDARLAVDRRENASRPKAKRRRAAVSSAPDEVNAEGLRESESLKRVFHDLGVSYREYRRQTGEPVAPAVRDAAYKFKAAPSLDSLVSVAGVLDELEILTW
jgi:hypothetical protein